MKVLEKFKIIFPNIKPTKIMTDFEISLQNALNEIYPEAEINSCWFHFVQALQKKKRKLGYTDYVKNNLQAKMCLKMTSVLPLLPRHQIRDGFDEIKSYARNNGVLLPRFFTYFSSFWLRDGILQRLSVYNQPRRTNNNIQSFHSVLKQSFQINHPNMWKVLENLQKTSMKYHILVQQLANGHQITRAMKIKFILNSTRIKNSALKLNAELISIYDFLLQCSHTTNGYLTRELNWIGGNAYEPIVISESEEEIDIEELPELPANPDIGDIEPERDNNIDIPPKWREEDFILPEDLDPTENMFREMEARELAEELQNIPNVPVPEILVQEDRSNLCVVCWDEEIRYALIPCGHQVLCQQCSTAIDPRKCPVCNIHFTATLRVWPR